MKVKHTAYLIQIVAIDFERFSALGHCAFVNDHDEIVVTKEKIHVPFAGGREMEVSDDCIIFGKQQKHKIAVNQFIVAEIQEVKQGYPKAFAWCTKHLYDKAAGFSKSNNNEKPAPKKSKSDKVLDLVGNKPSNEVVQTNAVETVEVTLKEVRRIRVMREIRGSKQQVYNGKMKGAIALRKEGKLAEPALFIEVETRSGLWVRAEHNPLYTIQREMTKTEPQPAMVA